MGFDSSVYFLSRELAIQIAEQFEALGADISLRCAVVSSCFNHVHHNLNLPANKN